MNDNVDYLVQHLMGRGMGQPQPQQHPMMQYAAMRNFLKTSQGRDAARAAVDKIIVDHNLLGQQPDLPHQEIFKMISGMMQQAQQQPTQQGLPNDELLGLRESDNLQPSPSSGLGGESTGGYPGMAPAQLRSPSGSPGPGSQPVIQ